MNSPIIVWFRADLRIHDHPALSAAAQAGDIVPLFIFDEQLTRGPRASANRTRFLIESLEDLRNSLRGLGGELFIRSGRPEKILAEIAKQTGARAVYYTAEYTPYALRRDKRVEIKLAEDGLEARSFGGTLAVDSLPKLLTKAGTPFKVFTPFWKAWREVGRRQLAGAPSVIRTPGLEAGELPDGPDDAADLSPYTLKGGESAARKRLHDFLAKDIESYHRRNNELAEEGTSRLSAYLHFGCVSVREIETVLPEGEGADAWHRQLAWRDFYSYVLFHFPHPDQEFRVRYRGLPWATDPRLLEAWKNGQTGYPVVDAAMRQLKQEGWMHNRARLIVGSFLTKDLGIDWREGEKHFMHWLIDGDVASNNGNWQWIGSVGVDPAPLFRRLYNPSSQRDRYDSTGEYVRRYVPELKNVPDRYLSEPWTMPEEGQARVGCKIGQDYPKPIVDHGEARQRAIERYTVASTSVESDEA